MPLTRNESLELQQLRKKYDSSAKISPPKVIKNFLPEEDFLHLKNLLQSLDKSLIEDDGNYSPFMNKTEYRMKIEGKFQEKILEISKSHFNSETLINTFNVYAVHECPSDLKKIPTVSEHLDQNQATYLVDLVIRSDFDWPIVANDVVAHLEENSAILFHPEDQLHYRTAWCSDNPNHKYEVAFFHYVEPDHWSIRYGLRHDPIEHKAFYGSNESEHKELLRYFELKRLEAVHEKHRTGLYQKLPAIPLPPEITKRF